MKAQLLLAGIILGMSGISACTGNKKDVMTEKETMEVWKDYPVGHIVFDDQAPETEGSKVYHRIILILRSILQIRHVQYLLHYMILRLTVLFRLIQFIILCRI